MSEVFNPYDPSTHEARRQDAIRRGDLGDPYGGPSTVAGWSGGVGPQPAPGSGWSISAPGSSTSTASYSSSPSSPSSPPSAPSGRGGGYDRSYSPGYDDYQARELQRQAAEASARLAEQEQRRRAEIEKAKRERAQFFLQSLAHPRLADMIGDLFCEFRNEGSEKITRHDFAANFSMQQSGYSQKPFCSGNRLDHFRTGQKARVGYSIENTPGRIDLYDASNVLQGYSLNLFGSVTHHDHLGQLLKNTGFYHSVENLNLSMEDGTGVAVLGSIMALAVTTVGIYAMRDECSVAAAGLMVAGAAYKITHDLGLSTFSKIVAAAVPVVATAVFVGSVAMNRQMPEGTVVSQFWDHREAILIGAGAAIAAYSAAKDVVSDELGWGTALKATIGAVLVSGGLYLGGAFDNLQSAASQLSHGTTTTQPQHIAGPIPDQEQKSRRKLGPQRQVFEQPR